MVAVGHLGVKARKAQKRGALHLRPRSLKSIRRSQAIWMSLSWLRAAVRTDRLTRKLGSRRLDAQEDSRVISFLHVCA